MELHYTDQTNILILIRLLKEHGIKKIVASPGVSNMAFVASVQQDPFFEMYSSIDERSAAYLATGLAAESGEPVVISCTGATASRNYMPGLTEAFYRKLPILAVTATREIALVGQNSPQAVDRSVIPNDIAKTSVHIPTLHTPKDVKNYTVLMNKAILELTHRGGGPVHINLTVGYGKDYSVKELPEVDVIRRISVGDVFPELPKGKIGIFVGAHKKWSDRLTLAVEQFCAKHNAVVFSDHISNYRGEYSVFSNIVTCQEQYLSPCCNMDIMIYIGDIIGADYQGLAPKRVWRVNPDGEIRNTLGNLQFTFEMEEEVFFRHYADCASTDESKNYLKKWKQECEKVRAQISDVPFSNIWIAKETLPRLPEKSVIHFGIQNSLRTWNFFEGPKSISGYCNTGGFGIDGCVSSLIGASFANRQQLYFGVVGDLAFFYDMNALGNRHIENNVRLIIVNNNGGQQFRNPNSAGSVLGEAANAFVAAAGHFGSQSKDLVKHFVQDLGFEYLCATDKKSYLENLEYFVSPEFHEKSIVFEVFANEKDETQAMKKTKNLLKEKTTASVVLESKVIARKVLGDKGITAAKKILQKVKK